MSADPKEIRFTRARQAVGFWLLAAMGLIAAGTLLLIAPYRGENPELPSPLWALPPLAIGWLSARVALHCTRRAYLILTPLGLEIFPFFRPAAGMRLISWAEIDAAEFTDSRLTLHFNPEKTSGVHLSLAPIPKDRRPLLRTALEGRLDRS